MVDATFYGKNSIHPGFESGRQSFFVFRKYCATIKKSFLKSEKAVCANTLEVFPLFYFWNQRRYVIRTVRLQSESNICKIHDLPTPEFEF